jgi:hypothetical protein
MKKKKKKKKKPKWDSGVRHATMSSILLDLQAKSKSRKIINFFFNILIFLINFFFYSLKKMPLDANFLAPPLAGPINVVAG